MEGNFLKLPQYLSSDKEENEDDFTVLTDRDTIKNISKDICNYLYHPVTILDANRIGESNLCDIRYDSDIEYLSLKDACRLFRHCAGNDKCHKCDKFHANMFVKYLKDTSENKKLDYSSYPDFFYDGYEKKPPKILEGYGRPVLEYHCPMLGYRELMFPIYFKNKLLGILVIGQSAIKDNESKTIDDPEFIKSVKNEFFEKNAPESLFADYVKKNNDVQIEDKQLTAEKIKSLIEEADDNFAPFEKLLRRTRTTDSKIEDKIVTMFFDTDKEYKDFIEKACATLSEKVEYIFEIVYDEKRKKYFEKISEEIVDIYFVEKAKIIETREDENTGNLRSYTEFVASWEQLTQTVDQIKESFKIKNIYVFGDGTSISMIENKKKYIYPKPNKGDEKEEWYVDFSSLEKEYIQNEEYITSFNNKGVFKGLYNVDIKDNLFMIVFSDMALLFEVDELSKHRDVYKTMADEIGWQFVKICSSIALSTANFMRDKQIQTLRMNRHETSHVSARLNGKLSSYFKNGGERFINAEFVKRTGIVSDMQNTVQLLSNMATNIGIITGSINSDNIKYESVDVYQSFLKWQSMFQDKLLERNLNFEIRIYDYGKRTIKTDREQFEIMLYNLIDNAVKYAYRGTNIYAFWISESGKNSKNKFRIINYGPEIRDKNRIFDLYYRGQINRANRVEGEGIGLYSVKRICKLMGCSIEVKNDNIAEYNLPLIEWYLKEYGINDYQNKKVVALRECIESYNDNEKENVINYTRTKITDMDITKEYLDKKIDKKIWKTEFTISFPDNN